MLTRPAYTFVNGGARGRPVRPCLDPPVTILLHALLELMLHFLIPAKIKKNMLVIIVKCYTLKIAKGTVLDFEICIRHKW